jgi:hypothetical protein
MDKQIYEVAFSVKVIDDQCRTLFYIAVCDKGTYGPNCSGDCGHCKGGATCDHVTGVCPSGECEPGWKQTTDQKCKQGLCGKSYHIMLYF